MSIEHNIPIVVYIGYDYDEEKTYGSEVAEGEKFKKHVKYSLNNFALDYPSQAYYAMLVGEQGRKYLLKK